MNKLLIQFRIPIPCLYLIFLLFAVIYLNGPNIFYVLPIEAFIAYGSVIHFVEEKKRQRKPLSADYRDAWDLIL
ncbi:hypothetical protein KKE99_02815, partial [Patescibacteria group bacterium]|nr:hypothetical protein [Patescibacteria group bacterium]